MTTEPEELWLPSRGDGLPECLLGEPLLILPQGASFFRLVTTSIWTPLTWGDSVRASPHPQGGYTVTGLAATAPHLRVLVSYDPAVPRMRARTVAHAWSEHGLLAAEHLPGLIACAWSTEAAATDALTAITMSSPEEGWEIIEAIPPEERTHELIAHALSER